MSQKNKSQLVTKTFTKDNREEQSNIKKLLINKPVILFDASCFLYIHGANENYKRSLKDHIEGTLLMNKTDRYVGIIDGKGNYRKDVAFTLPYKGNRSKTDILERFPYFYEVKKELIETYGFHLVHGIEADDAVAILNRRMNNITHAYIYDTTWNEEIETSIQEENYKPKLIKRELIAYSSVIASIDKDLKQVPGIHYNLKSHKYVLSTESSSYIGLNTKRNGLVGHGYKFLYAQVLIGDMTDNIRGLEKCGPVCAYKTLKDCDTQEECMEAIFEAYFAKEKYNENKRILELKRSSTKHYLSQGFVKKEAQEKGHFDAEQNRIPDIELLKIAKLKVEETYNLVYILRRQANLPAFKIHTYNF